MRRLRSGRAAILAGVLIIVGTGTAAAQDSAAQVDQALDSTMQRQRDNVRSQTRINQLDDATREALQRYRAALWQSQQLDAYAGQLDQLLGTQSEEMASLRSQLDELQVTEREILPLMLRMLDGLERFVDEDLPFLQGERQERVDNLRRSFADPATTTAENFSRLIDAYQVEYEYGRGLGAERAALGEDGAVVDILRVGRVGLFYRQLDGAEVGAWDARQQAWHVLPDRFEPDIRQGLRIARETAAASMLVLPLAAPGAAQ
ncbi:MAG: DUF3450 domain-containing protein [Gammaproteobacteria bacterium]|nr:DUF3450 domain-containing protein [Gammaproteobacteria bacterium]